jgi:hypothetical protein
MHLATTGQEPALTRPVIPLLAKLLAVTPITGDMEQRLFDSFNWRE